MIINRRTFFGATLAFMGPDRLGGRGPRVFTPEAFGAKGDGRTNDSAAMARLARAVTNQGGGDIVFRKTTYLVGEQEYSAAGLYFFPPNDIFRFGDCPHGLSIHGNGARLLCASGLRYGTFDRDGRAVHYPMPYLGEGLATPYMAMIDITGCTGPVSIVDIELEGPGDDLILGGSYGDTGWQIPATGLFLRNNSGSETIEDIYTHGHPLDGLQIDGLDADANGVTRRFRKVVADRNGRQGCSLVGGRDYQFIACIFQRTGRGKVQSAPGAGVDIEAEAGKCIRRISFSLCRFVDNHGSGLTADQGDSEHVTFDGCTFIGTTNWSAWPAKPFMKFDRCTFAGAIVNAYGSEDPIRAAQFRACTFSDDTTVSPGHQLYGGTNKTMPLADLSGAKNVLFDHCRFIATRGVLPWSVAAIYRDCTMRQGVQDIGYPRGRYVGTTTIKGRVDLYSSKIAGTLIVNGKVVH
ncbi:MULTISPECIES: hypothetical protein [unclassified Sphingomonas]|uniref:hypothetical protein n=1 Tax=unclassified Sphingomonas TaxID=196159 RepID=UPI00226B00A6|nr:MULTISPECIES: hypothetical protein [unclassified Sphingomonas]